MAISTQTSNVHVLPFWGGQLKFSCLSDRVERSIKSTLPLDCSIGKEYGQEQSICGNAAILFYSLATVCNMFLQVF